MMMRSADVGGVGARHRNMTPARTMHDENAHAARAKQFATPAKGLGHAQGGGGGGLSMRTPARVPGSALKTPAPSTTKPRRALGDITNTSKKPSRRDRPAMAPKTPAAASTSAAFGILPDADQGVDDIEGAFGRGYDPAQDTVEGIHADIGAMLDAQTTMGAGAAAGELNLDIGSFSPTVLKKKNKKKTMEEEMNDIAADLDFDLDMDLDMDMGMDD